MGISKLVFTLLQVLLICFLWSKLQLQKYYSFFFFTDLAEAELSYFVLFKMHVIENYWMRQLHQSVAQVDWVQL